MECFATLFFFASMAPSAALRYFYLAGACIAGPGKDELFPLLQMHSTVAMIQTVSIFLLSLFDIAPLSPFSFLSS